MKYISTFVFVGLFVSVVGLNQAHAFSCAGESALAQGDIIIRPGETKIVLYDFSSGDCLLRNYVLSSLYLADPMYPVSGCSNSIKGISVQMELLDLTTGQQGFNPVVRGKTYNTAVYMYDANGNANGSRVTGHVLQLKIKSNESTKCRNVNLRWSGGIS